MNIQGHELRASSREWAANPANVAARAATPISQLAACCSQVPRRRGISLLEVLISMFVLLFGLMGVAAIFPVGNHYAGRGEQFDRGSALAEAAFAELKARGMLQPEHWYYANPPAADAQYTPPAGTPSPVLLPPSAGAAAQTFNVPFGSDNQPGYAFVIDPIGTAQGLEAATPITAGLDYFPYINLTNASTTDGTINADLPPGWKSVAIETERWPVRRVTRPVPNPANPSGPPLAMTSAVAQTIFQLHDDVTNELPKENDRPGIQRWNTDSAGALKEEPWRHKLLSRSFTGGYSWLATVVPASIESLVALQPVNSRFGSDLYEVSVAVLHKREALPPSTPTERTIAAQMLQGNELVIYDPNADNVDAAVQDVRVGQWILVAGVHPTTGQFLMKWYRILSLDDETDETTGPNPLRRAMLDGPAWPMTTTSGVVTPANNLRAIILPGVISVATQMLPMEAAP
ncbi:MAG: prepilin-type N-terminal cleavage/methylation domain-containing protein [Planctomycetaceae bacterium]|nr:prepilin-type N-terminal cleavage/methylation domain-containing protein [Planctomycetaceae bacterium]